MKEDREDQPRSRRSVAWLATGATLAAFLLRFGIAVALHRLELPRNEEPVREAISFHETGVLANPYLTPTGPTAHLAPLYPLMLGELYNAVGAGRTAGLWQTVLGCLLSALRSGVILWLALFLNLNFRTAILASLLSISYISALDTEISGAWEAPLVALVLMLWTALLVHLYRMHSLSLRRALLYGVLCGVSLLLSTSLLPALAGFCLLGLWVIRQQRPKALLWCGIFWLTALAVLSPWAARNQRQLGSPILLRSNAGLELWGAYHEGSSPSVLSRAFGGHPSANAAESELVARLGEVAYNKRKEKQALDWIFANPAKTGRLLLLHMVYFWFFPEPNLLMRVLLACFTLTSLCGWIILWRSRQIDAATTIGCLWLCFPAMYYIFVWSSRYRYPIEWSLLATTAVFLDWVWRTWQSQPVSERYDRRV
jgi:hypothetical protein